MTATTSIRLVKPSPIVLSPSVGLLREPTRPVDLRGANFVEEFDFTTLFFDAFFTDRPGSVLLVGPPFANLSSNLETAIFTANPSGLRCSFRTRMMDRHSQMWLEVPEDMQTIELKSRFGTFELAPAANLSFLFEGKRVLLTLSKNNRLEWIQDWARYNRDIHGADAVLFYDNQSTAYRLEDLAEALAGVSGFDQICIVQWPFKYGPQGIDLLRCWDSDFCQPGAWEHARWMFLQRCRSVLNSDIDELVVPVNDKTTVFDAAEKSWTGLVRFPGVWVIALPSDVCDETKQLIRHNDCRHYVSSKQQRKLDILRPKGELNTKWAIVPRRCPHNSQWMAHTIYGWRGLYSNMSTDRRFCYRHFVDISDDWKRDRVARANAVRSSLVFDKGMISMFSRVDWRI